MPSFTMNRRVRYRPEDMFDLVCDIEKYPLFVPLCSALKVRSEQSQPDGRIIKTADMTVAYKLIRETFGSRVTMDRDKLLILVEYLDGPFSHLENRWSFKSDNTGGCTVEFFINYSFRSRMLAVVMGAVFDSAFRRFADAFEKRADQVYGNGGKGQVTSQHS